MGFGVRNSSINTNSFPFLYNHLQTPHWGGGAGRLKIVSAYRSSQNGKGKTRGVFFLCMYFQIGSERSLRKISVHLLPRLHSVNIAQSGLREAGEMMEMHRKPHPNPHG